MFSGTHQLIVINAQWVLISCEIIQVLIWILRLVLLTNYNNNE